MAYATVKDLIKASLREIGVLGAGDALKDSVADIAFEVFADLIDALKIDRLALFTSDGFPFVLSNGVASYAVGPGQTFNMDRPDWIDTATVTRSTDVPTFEYEMDGPLEDEEWAAIRMKGLTDSLPRAFQYRPTFPYGEIEIWPVPNVSTLGMILYAPVTLVEPPTLATALSLAPGYRRMLRTNLAVELASGAFTRAISPLLVKRAIESKADVLGNNIEPIIRTPDPCLNAWGGQAGSRYNIRTNGYNK